MNRTQWVLAGILALQVVLLGVVIPWTGGQDGGSPRLLLPELESFTPARIEIEEGNDKSVVVRHEGATWTLEAQDGYPADSSKLEGILENLEALKVRRPVVSGSRYHAALKVTEDDHERRVRIWDDASDDPKVDLFVGTSPNYRISHVRRGGDDRVYEARGLSAYDLRAEPGAWVEKQLIDVNADDVVSIKLRNEHGELALEKNEEGSWTIVEPPAAKAPDPAAVDSFVGSLTSLWLVDPAGTTDRPELGLDAPVATVEIAYREGGAAELDEKREDPEEAADESGEGETAQSVEARPVLTVELRVGAEVEGGEGKRYAARGGFAHGVVVSKYDAEKILDKKLDDLYADQE